MEVETCLSIHKMLGFAVQRLYDCQPFNNRPKPKFAVTVVAEGRRR